MANVTHPSKQKVHNWMTRTRDTSKPLPTIDEIKRALGWHMLPNNRKAK